MEDKRQVREINASSMADIAFLLLIFFLVATTMNTDTGIARILPAIPPDEIQAEDQKVKERDLLLVFVSQYDAILVGNQRTDISELRNKIKEFVLNVTDAENMPEKEIRDIEMPDGSVWSVPVSKAVVSLTNDKGTSYDLYIQVQNELTRAYNEMRNDVAHAKFGRDFAKLSEEESEVIRKALPQQISEGELINAGGN